MGLSMHPLVHATESGRAMRCVGFINTLLKCSEVMLSFTAHHDFRRAVRLQKQENIYSFRPAKERMDSLSAV